jgi:hypothetical protein
MFGYILSTIHSPYTHTHSYIHPYIDPYIHSYIHYTHRWQCHRDLVADRCQPWGEIFVSPVHGWYRQRGLLFEDRLTEHGRCDVDER